MIGRAIRAGAAALAVAAWALTAAAATAQVLNGDIRIAADRHGLGAAKVGVCVIDAATGATLADLGAELPLIPASNQKVITSGAALAVLGPDFTFTTELRRAGPTLVVRGSGDPALADPVLLKEMGMSVEGLLDAWVDAVRRSGGGPVTTLILDDRTFDQERIHPSWPTDQLNRWYCAEVSGLNFHTNIVSIFARPGAPGTAPEFVLEPRADWLTITNRARSTGTGKNTLWASRMTGSDAITLMGELRWPMEEPLDVTVDDPAMFLGRALASRLDAAGLGRAAVRRAEPGEALPDGAAIAVVRTPMDVVLRRCNVNSYNLYADALFKRMAHEVTGQPGGWSTGAAVVRMVVQQRLGPTDASSIAVADGSGMSRDNRVSPGVLARWLASIAEDDRIGEAFIASLPRAQEDGSLARRFSGERLTTEIRAKTGYLLKASSLSGYVTAPDSGRRVVFTVIVNDYSSRTPLQAVRDFQEAVALIVQRWLTGAKERSPSLGG